MPEAFSGCCSIAVGDRLDGKSKILCNIMSASVCVRVRMRMRACACTGAHVHVWVCMLLHVCVSESELAGNVSLSF